MNSTSSTNEYFMKVNRLLCLLGIHTYEIKES